MPKPELLKKNGIDCYQNASQYITNQTTYIKFLGEALIENSVGEKNVDFALDLTSGWKAPKDCAEEMLAVEFLLWYSEARKMKRFPFDILMYLGKDNMGKYKISATTSMYAPYVFSVYDKTDVYNNYMKIDWKIFANFLVKSPPVDTANPWSFFFNRPLMETSLANLNLIIEPATDLSGWLSIVNSLDYYDITESKCRGCQLYIPQNFEAG